MKNLVIVESPTKARTIGRFLGKDYEIKASMGHIMDLPKSKLGVNEKTFEPQYELVSEKRMAISDLKEGSRKAESIIIATDPDREGEAIASHIKQILSEKDTKILSKKNKNLLISQYPNISSSKFKRIVFHEITKEAIEEALKNPRDIDQALVDAQTARRVLDRLVGYKISPVLWQKVRRGLSAGRVQSVALRLIVEREREIEKFKKEKYYTITAVMVNLKSHAAGIASGDARQITNNKEETEFELIEIDGEKVEFQETLNLYDGQYKITKTTLDNLGKTQRIVEDLERKNFEVLDILKKEIRRSPYPPFTTSTLQQEASRRLFFSGRRTMSLAQKLYEEGFITYHRTDSVVISQSATFALRNYVKKEFGDKYLPEKPRFYKTKQKLAQEAHEAIRPTGLNNQPSTINNQLGRDYGKLYELIWRRALASQMSDAIIEQTNVLVDSGDKKYRLKANGSVLLFDGFLKITPQALNDIILPDFKVNEEINFKEILWKEHETTPPSRYNDASLVATLEEKGIGRPSTYATIISTIESRRYIERQEGRFVPTYVGIAVSDFLVENFSSIDDIPFTASMEDELDAIANEKKEWVPVIEKFYSELAQKLEGVKGAQRVKIETEETDERCPKCGSKLVIRIGRFGKFLSCSTFPKCDFTKPYLEEVGIPCPKCGKDKGGQVISRKTRKGRKFYGCSNYPNCNFAAWKLEDIKKNKK
ncbi:MAG: DNA topoisomerase I [Candidatus Levybacteria bacterium RIFCSPLOWO2_01_FULL_38_13]|nr:MAG: DNA topoisomerase I [Candidatus Levybacteria bacterium RIFCSPHIGHO2_01_FULL_41_15]OGH35739.1 MAG: DNA topoisomerase I [Candidatus Levybacteria bacterium RIFCSPLOWO2_01_FULL_38_13]